MRRFCCALLWLLILLTLPAAGCALRSNRLEVAGSTSVQPLADRLARAYRQEGGAWVVVQGGGSSAGIEAVRSGVVQVGMASRSLTAEESDAGLVAHRIAHDLLVLILHPSHPVDQLSTEQLRHLFAGQVTDWAEVGGRPGPVRLISREAGSGSREAFRQLVGPVSPRAIILGSAGAVRAAVMQDPQAIGYVSLPAARAGGVKMVAVDGRWPGEPGYRLWRPFLLVTRGQPDREAASFIRFVLSPPGQRLVQEEGLVPVGAEGLGPGGAERLGPGGTEGRGPVESEPAGP